MGRQAWTGHGLWRVPAAWCRHGRDADGREASGRRARNCARCHVACRSRLRVPVAWRAGRLSHRGAEAPACRGTLHCGHPDRLAARSALRGSAWQRHRIQPPRARRPRRAADASRRALRSCLSLADRQRTARACPAQSGARGAPRTTRRLCLRDPRQGVSPHGHALRPQGPLPRAGAQEGRQPPSGHADGRAQRVPAVASLPAPAHRRRRICARLDGTALRVRSGCRHHGKSPDRGTLPGDGAGGAGVIRSIPRAPAAHAGGRGRAGTHRAGTARRPDAGAVGHPIGAGRAGPAGHGGRSGLRSRDRAFSGNAPHRSDRPAGRHGRHPCGPAAIRAHSGRVGADADALRRAAPDRDGVRARGVEREPPAAGAPGTAADCARGPGERAAPQPRQPRGHDPQRRSAGPGTCPSRTTARDWRSRACAAATSWPMAAGPGRFSSGPTRLAANCRCGRGLGKACGWRCESRCMRLRNRFSRREHRL